MNMEDGNSSEISEVSKKFWGDTFKHLKNAEAISNQASNGVIAFGLIATVCGIAVSSEIFKDWNNWFSLAGIMGAIFAVTCAVVQKFLEKDHTELLEQAKKSLDQTQAYLYQRQEIVRQIEDMKDLDDQRLQLQSAFVYMIEKAEDIILSGGQYTTTVTIEKLFEVCQAEILGSMGMTYSEKMTISVYQVDKASPSGEEILNIIVNKKPNKAEEQDYTSRSWKKGEGYSGQAWMQADEVVVPDSFLVPDSYHVKNLSEKSPDQRAELKRYRSVAAVPILVGRSNEVWGVVSVTTDRPNKFSTTSLDDDVAAQNVETVRILAKMIAVLVACCATSHKKAPPSTTVESGGTDEAL